jgi:hypothetical protein
MLNIVQVFDDRSRVVFADCARGLVDVVAPNDRAVATAFHTGAAFERDSQASL